MKTHHADAESTTHRDSRQRREAEETRTENAREACATAEAEEKPAAGGSLISIHAEVLVLQKSLEAESRTLPEACWKHLRHIENLTSGNSERLRAAVAAELREFRFQLADTKVPVSQPHLNRLDKLVNPETPKARRTRLDREALSFPDETPAQRTEREKKTERADETCKELKAA